MTKQQKDYILNELAELKEAVDNRIKYGYWCY